MDEYYFITDRCAGCGGCHSVCPSDCIDALSHPLVIDQTRCNRCGVCYTACPIRAIEKRAE